MDHYFSLYMLSILTIHAMTSRNLSVHFWPLSKADRHALQRELWFLFWHIDMYRDIGVQIGPTFQQSIVSQWQHHQQSFLFDSETSHLDNDDSAKGNKLNLMFVLLQHFFH